MEYRKLDITVISADGLKDVGLFSKMDVYVTVSLSDDPRSKCRTPVDKDGGKSPKWNHKVNLYVYEHSLSNSPAVIFTIRADRIVSDKDIGEVVVPVKELFDSSTSDSSERVVEYEVHTPKGKSKGKLKFSYKFGDKSTLPQVKATEPMAAYPAYGGPSTAYPPGYAPPPPAYGTAHAYQAPPPAGYGYPQQAAYGYPPQQQGYGGYPPQGYGGYPPPQMVQAPPQKKRNNMGLGLGLGAGLLGGLLVGDMISDIGDSSGFDDGGFDF